MWLFSFYLLLVARLRFSLVYLCVQFVFSAAALYFFLLHVNLIWPSCVNCTLLGKFPLLHHVLQDIFTYTLFWLIRVNLSLKNQLPYDTINFRFLETNVCLNQISYAMNVPITFIIFFFGEGNSNFNENAFPSYQIHRHWSLTCSKTLHCCASSPIQI